MITSADAALDPPRAHGMPLASGIIRAAPEDFIVEEDLGFAPAGTGQHVLLKIRKRDANTQWVAKSLGRTARCRPFDVGYAGLKDRRAVALQWFSVPRSAVTLEQWKTVTGDGFEIVEAHEHTRKLPRGALAGNRFLIRIRGMSVEDAALRTRLEEIGRLGVPNYFGAQRFGREGGNLSRIPDDIRDLRPPERGFVLSAARSLVFNAVAAHRVREGTWNRMEAGDIANLDSRGSVFPVDGVDEAISNRCAALDIHPTGPLWGRGVPTSRDRVAMMETTVAAQFPRECSLVEQAGMEQERRALRLAVRDLEWQREPDGAVFVAFKLTKGSFATTVLREIVDSEGGGEEKGED
jgi:tRNA pseudouridine13 synthase